jgi:hypothetical protein
VIAGGVFKVPLWRFLPSLALGAFLYILMYTLLGYFLGPTVLDVVAAVHLPLGVLGSLVPLVLLLVWIARARHGLDLGPTTEAGAADRRHRWRDGAVASGLATLVSTLTMNVLVHAVGGLVLLEPGDLIERTRARVAVLVFCAGHRARVATRGRTCVHGCRSLLGGGLRRRRSSRSARSPR